MKENKPLHWKHIGERLIFVSIILILMGIGNKQLISYYIDRFQVKFFRTSYFEALVDKQLDALQAEDGALEASAAGCEEEDLAELIYSDHAILVDLEDHEVVFSKASETRTYPASLTKIMTTLVAIEALPELDAPITLPQVIFEPLETQGASMAGFEPGETVRAIDLIYGTMLPSGADAALGLAKYIAGSEDAYVELMNQKAKALGMTHTHFTNVTGLHDKAHYTSTSDLAKLLEVALREDLFYDIITTHYYQTGSTNKHPHGICFENTMFESLNGINLAEGEIIGGKTGYTNEAGLCLVSIAQRGNKSYMLITTGAEGSHSTLPYNLVDAFTVYERYL